AFPGGWEARVGGEGRTAASEQQPERGGADRAPRTQKVRLTPAPSVNVLLLLRSVGRPGMSRDRRSAFDEELCAYLALSRGGGGGGGGVRAGLGHGGPQVRCEPDVSAHLTGSPTPALAEEATDVSPPPFASWAEDGLNARKNASKLPPGNSCDGGRDDLMAGCEFPRYAMKAYASAARDRAAAVAWLPFSRPPGFEPSADDQFSYCPSADVWFDGATGVVSRYDPDSRTYHPLDPTSRANLLEQVAAEDAADNGSLLRLVVLESAVLCPGRVVVVDHEGVTVGRDRSFGRRLRLPELAVSKFHAHIYVDDDGVGLKPVENTDSVRSLTLAGATPAVQRSESYPASVHQPAGEHANQEQADTEERPATAGATTRNVLFGSTRKKRHGTNVVPEVKDGDPEDAELALSGTTSGSAENVDVPDSAWQTGRQPSWCIIDTGSTQGTFVNDFRLSEARFASRPCALQHLDVVRIGGTSFQVHLHLDTNRACDTCRATTENIVNIDEGRNRSRDATRTAPVASANNDQHAKSQTKRGRLEADRADELKRLKRKYACVATRPRQHTAAYVDRAAARRELKPDKGPPRAPAGAA
ncbi:MAG: hypothetical protein BJ554DRAFT_8239, partial [Olpidium bornovanus]